MTLVKKSAWKKCGCSYKNDISLPSTSSLNYIFVSSLSCILRHYRMKKILKQWKERWTPIELEKTLNKGCQL